MVIMNTDPMLVHVAEQVSDFCMFLSIPRPSSEYIWYHDEHYSSEEGHAFERRVVDAILAVREQLS